MTGNERVHIYDSTLRDGAQAVGITFSQSGKLRHVRKLDELGVSFIEGGYAGSNPKDMQFFADVRKENLTHSKIVAFGSTRRAGKKVADDPFVQALLAAETEYCAIYGRRGSAYHAKGKRADDRRHRGFPARKRPTGVFRRRAFLRWLRR